jgi:DNA polymerase-3 subunit delta
MSVVAQRALRTAIEKRQFDPVYYLHGNDEYRKGEAVTRIMSAALDAGTQDFNFDAFRGSDVDAERLAVSLTSLPVFAARRVVVVRDVAALNKRARAHLDHYLLTPAPDVVLILTESAGAKADADIMRRSTSVPFAPLTGEQVVTWLVQHATANGFTLPVDCAALVAEAAGGDLTYAVAELDKLASYASGREIKPADVEATLGIRDGETISDLLDAVAARDGVKAYRLVEPVLAQPKTTAVQIVMNLSAQVLAMAWARAALDAGMPVSRLDGELFGILKSGGGVPGRPYGEAVKSWIRNLSRWSRQDLQRALTHLLTADVALKDTRFSSDEAAIGSLVLALCVPAERSGAA